MSRFDRTDRKLALAALATVAAGCAPTHPTGSPTAIPELAARTAGTSQNCVPVDQASSLRVADERTVLYGSGQTIWVNHLRSECRGADRMDILVVEPTGAQYCSGDQVRLLDPLTRIPGAVCALGDFVPYSR